eukprot:GEMP01003578.1.p1 GENE.GEMP01003578.1~~GEMP01003578.1.p1  ORF type:complete len:834 (+),score=156.71 GEMP01003578.1:93-2594(+)
MRRGLSRFALASRADAVIVGGGAAGSSVLYHLAKNYGIKGVLLEKDQLTSGTTWHSAGLHWRLRPNDSDIELLHITRELCKTGGTLHQETDMDVWTANGGLFCANNHERLNEYKRLQTIGRFFGIDSQILSPADAKDVYPLIGNEDLVGCLYSPGDGLIDPSGVVMAYVKGAKQFGATVEENCSVTDVEVVDNKVKAVITSKGRIETPLVINAAGVWADKLGAMVGVEVPLIAMRHAYVVTEPIPGLGFVPNIRDHDLSVYMKYQGQSLAIGGYEPNPMFIDDMPQDFHFGLYDLDWDVFGFNMEGHIKRVPALETVGIAHTVCGPESFTPDHKALVGPTSVEGFWLTCGYNSAGIMLSGGCGNQLAEWIVKGAPSIDMFGYDPNRLPSGHKPQKWLRDRSHEAYAKNYSIVFPNDQALAGRQLKKGPFYDRLSAAGCFHIVACGWERPYYFVDGINAEVKDYDYYGAYEHTPAHKTHTYNDLLRGDYTFQWPGSHKYAEEQHHYTRNVVTALDMSAFGKLEISGPDARAAMEWICSAKVKKTGKTTYTQMLNKAGRIECDLTVSALTDDMFYICTPGGSQRHDVFHITSNLTGFNVTVKDVTDEWGVLSIQGRKSKEILQRINIPVDIPFGTCQVVKRPYELRVIRLTFVGELGFELHVPTQNAEALYDELTKAAPELKNIGYAAVESLSMEKGYRHWHQDVRWDDTPKDAGMMWVCKKSPAYLGQESLLSQKSIKRLVYVYPEGLGKTAIYGLETICRNGVPCGFLRRGGYAFSLGKPLGVAYIHHGDVDNVEEYIGSGTYEIEVMGAKYPCTVGLSTPFDPTNERIKGKY